MLGAPIMDSWCHQIWNSHNFPEVLWALIYNGTWFISNVITVLSINNYWWCSRIGQVDNLYCVPSHPFCRHGNVILHAWCCSSCSPSSGSLCIWPFVPSCKCYGDDMTLAWQTSDWTFHIQENMTLQHKPLSIGSFLCPCLISKSFRQILVWTLIAHLSPKCRIDWMILPALCDFLFGTISAAVLLCCYMIE